MATEKGLDCRLSTVQAMSLHMIVQEVPIVSRHTDTVITVNVRRMI